MPAPMLFLVDDASEVTFLVRRLTRQAGWELVACRDASEALRCLETVQPDLAIVDVNLPGMSGLELCTRLRQLPGRETTPIALFTHPRQTEDVVAGLEAGADFVLSKDLLAQPDAWRARVEEILQACRDRGKTRSFELDRGPPPTTLPGDGIPAFNEALRHSALRQLGQPVIRFHLDRVLRRLVAASEGQPDIRRPNGAASWLLPDDLGLTAAAFPASGRAGWVRDCAAALAEEITAVWGKTAGRVARTALAAVAGENANDG